MKKNRNLLLIIFLLLSIALWAISKSAVYVESKLCVGCGDCQAVCPVDAVTIIDGKSVIDAEKCILCEICIKSCTYQAIRKSP